MANDSNYRQAVAVPVFLSAIPDVAGRAGGASLDGKIARVDVVLVGQCFEGIRRGELQLARRCLQRMRASAYADYSIWSADLPILYSDSKTR